jgi:hypothetical protein
MLNVQSSERPLAYYLAKDVVMNEVSNQQTTLESNNTFKFSGTPENSGDVIYDF